MDTPPRPSPLAIVMLAAMLGVICAMVSAATAPTVYRATAIALVSRMSATTVADVGPSPEVASRASADYADVAVSPLVLEPVIRQLGLATTPARLAAQIRVAQPADTVLLEVTVADEGAARAAAIANAVTGRLAAVSSRLTPKAASPETLRVTQVRAAAQPQSPSALALPLVVLIGLVSGGGIAALVLLVTRQLRRRPPPPGGLLAPSML